MQWGGKLFVRPIVTALWLHCNVNTIQGLPRAVDTFNTLIALRLIRCASASGFGRIVTTSTQSRTTHHQNGSRTSPTLGCYCANADKSLLVTRLFQCKPTGPHTKTILTHYDDFLCWQYTSCPNTYTQTHKFMMKRLPDLEMAILIRLLMVDRIVLLLLLLHCSELFAVMVCVCKSHQLVTLSHGTSLARLDAPSHEWCSSQRASHLLSLKSSPPKMVEFGAIKSSLRRCYRRTINEKLD